MVHEAVLSFFSYDFSQRMVIIVQDGPRNQKRKSNGTCRF